MQKRKVGIFGGTFDPIHNGHLQAALEVQQQLQLDEVRWVPCHIPPHKQLPQASATQRLTMIQLAIAEQADFIADDCELDRREPSYTIDTLKMLHAQHKDDITFYLFIGSDAFNQIHQWSQWQSLLDYAHLVIINRAGHFLKMQDQAMQSWLAQHLCSSLKQPITQTKNAIFQLSVTAAEISSSNIRQRLAQNSSIDFLVPTSVMSYIRAHNLYTAYP